MANSQKEIKLVQFRPGAIVVVENAANPGYFYLVRSGLLEIDPKHSLEDHALSRFGPGDSFGLVSALTGNRFLTTIYAKQSSTVYQIPIASMGEFLISRRELAMRVLLVYSRELRALHNHFARANAPEERGRSPERLYEQALIYEKWKQPQLVSYTLQRYVDWAAEQPVKPEFADLALKKLDSMSAPSGPAWNDKHGMFMPDHPVFVENELSDEFYVVLEGSIKLFNIVREREFILDVLGPGEIFGEMAMIDQSPRMASAIAAERSKLLRVTKETVMDTVGAAVLQKIFQSLARRIWISHQRLAILRIPDPIPRLYGFLYNMIRNQKIKSGSVDEKKKVDYSFLITMDELLVMCGIMKIDPEKLQPFYRDANLVIETNQIRVLNAKKIEEKVSSYLGGYGQISVDLI